MNIGSEVLAIAKQAKEASLDLGSYSSKAKDEALISMSEGLRKNTKAILKANRCDLGLAKKEGLPAHFIKRLILDEHKIAKMSDSIRRVASLEDPLGKYDRMWKRPNGILIGKVRVPIGVIGIIYESRPDVTSDSISLTLKSGNSVILRGGREAINSNIAIFEALNAALIRSGFPKGTINIIRTTDREAVRILLGLSDYIDLVIPRGGEGLIREVVKSSRIPVIKQYKGVCHTYVDKDADFDMAIRICINAKVQRPEVCNAMETLLVDECISKKFLPLIARAFKKHNVELRGCEKTRRILNGVKPATEEDWSTEYLDLILSVKVVRGVGEAISHINKYSTKHSEAIVTENYRTAKAFLERIDSACVYLNASTRLTDGGEFGMGSEIGISTDKLHARGPMGIEELTTYKYVIYGEGQIRQ